MVVYALLPVVLVERVDEDEDEEEDCVRKLESCTKP
jgi:hypothetical protein